MTQLTRRVLSTLLGSSLLLCGAAPVDAQSADEAKVMADFFRGTLEIDLPAGNWSAKRYLAADHTYRETGSDGAVTGTWAVQNGKICTTAASSAGLDRAKTYCNVGVGKKAGDMWRDEDPVTGNAVMFKLSPGR